LLREGGGGHGSRVWVEGNTEGKHSSKRENTEGKFRGKIQGATRRDKSRNECVIRVGVMIACDGEGGGGEGARGGHGSRV
jgi:hypothetical protein